MTKAKEFMKSEEVKSMKARATDGDEQMFLHYDIAIGAALSLWHILSLIFYCDFTKLCTDFSSSFRAIKPFETLRNIKKRNAMYYWMSRYLRELVELFGQCSYGEYDKKIDKYVNKIIGPFFTGLSVR